MVRETYKKVTTWNYPTKRVGRPHSLDVTMKPNDKRKYTSNLIYHIHMKKARAFLLFEKDLFTFWPNTHILDQKEGKSEEKTG